MPDKGEPPGESQSSTVELVSNGGKPQLSAVDAGLKDISLEEDPTSSPRVNSPPAMRRKHSQQEGQLSPGAALSGGRRFGSPGRKSPPTGLSHPTSRVRASWPSCTPRTPHPDSCLMLKRPVTVGSRGGRSLLQVSRRLYDRTADCIRSLRYAVTRQPRQVVILHL